MYVLPKPCLDSNHSVEINRCESVVTPILTFGRRDTRLWPQREVRAIFPEKPATAQLLQINNAYGILSKSS
ncbi:MAG: hypothetical protein WCU80_02125 [Paludibacteraceae bacterium]|nr:hypothetical protein [Prevotellaceae bacterium]